MIAYLFAMSSYGAPVDNVIVLNPPGPDHQFCVYRRDPSELKWVWYLAIADCQSTGPLCTTVYPGCAYARLVVPRWPEPNQPFRLTIQGEREYQKRVRNVLPLSASPATVRNALLRRQDGHLWRVKRNYRLQGVFFFTPWGRNDAVAARLGCVGGQNDAFEATSGTGVGFQASMWPESRPPTVAQGDPERESGRIAIWRRTDNPSRRRSSRHHSRHTTLTRCRRLTDAVIQR